MPFAMRNKARQMAAIKMRNAPKRMWFGRSSLMRLTKRCRYALLSLEDASRQRKTAKCGLIGMIDDHARTMILFSKRASRFLS
jgi:hypothetical protein